MTLRWLDRGIELLLGAALAALVAIGGAQVFWRFVLDDPLTWALETSVILLVWATMLSGYLGVRRNAHLSADFLGWASGGRWQRRRELLALLLSLLFVAVYGTASLQVIDAMDGIAFTSIPVEQPVLYWALPVGAALMALALVVRIAARWRDRGA